jgi:hypothetical protein
VGFLAKNKPKYACLAKKYANFVGFFLDVHDLCGALYKQDEVWFFILPCDWRFLPELGPPPN